MQISDYKQHSSGHQYFTLKDQRAQIACVIWRDTVLPQRPLLDGARVQVYGTVTGTSAEKTIHTVAAISPKMKIRTRVSDGEFTSEVL